MSRVGGGVDTASKVHPHIYSRDSLLAFWTPCWFLPLPSPPFGWACIDASGATPAQLPPCYFYFDSSSVASRIILNPSMLAYSNRHLSKWAFWRRLHRNVNNSGEPGWPCEFFFKGLLPVTRWQLRKSPWGLPGNMPLSGEDTDRQRQWLSCSDLWGQACSTEKERTDISNRISLL